jgi:hypothetical protein
LIQNAQPNPGLRSSLFSLANLLGPSTRFVSDAYPSKYEGIFKIQESNDADSEWGDSWGDILEFKYKRASDGVEQRV